MRKFRENVSILHKNLKKQMGEEKKTHAFKSSVFTMQVGKRWETFVDNEDSVNN